MRKVTGNIGIALVECINPKKDKWKVRWNVVEKDEGIAEYMEEDFGHKPSESEIKDVVIRWFNLETEKRIQSGFEWNGLPVWLSLENQFNYKSAFDTAVMSNGATLPVMFKFGTDEEPIYHEFTTVEELSDFYYKVSAHIQAALKEGWNHKESFNIKDYQTWICI